MTGQLSAPPARPVAGLLWMTATAACYACSYIILRKLSADLSIFVIMLLRSIIACALLGPWILAIRPRAIRITRFKLYGFRSLATYGAMMCTTYGVANVAIADVTALLFASPLFTVLFASMFLGEKVGPRRAAALLVGIAGALVIIRPGFETVTFASISGLVAAFGYGISNAGTKSLTGTDHPDTVAFWMYALIVPIAVPGALLTWTAPGWHHAPILLLLGVFTMASQFCMARAFSAADTSVVLPAHYLQMPFAAGLAFLLLAEVPSVWVWVGAAIIAASAYYTALRERQLARR